MTAALAAQPLPFTGRRGVEQGRRARKKVKGMPARVTMIERLDGDGVRRRPSSSSTRSHRYGTLTLTFVAHGSGLAGNARRLFQNIVRGCISAPSRSSLAVGQRRAHAERARLGQHRLTQRDVGDRQPAVPEEDPLVVALAAGPVPADDLAQLGMEVVLR